MLAESAEPETPTAALTAQQLDLLKQTWTLLATALEQGDREAADAAAGTGAAKEPAASSWSLFGSRKAPAGRIAEEVAVSPKAAPPPRPARAVSSAAQAVAAATDTAAGADAGSDADAAGSPFPLLHELGLAMHGEHPDRFVLRYLRARKWVPKDAVAMLVAMLRWRATFGVRRILFESEATLYLPELRRCQSYFYGRDLDGRLCCFIHVDRHVPSDLKRDLSQKLIVLTMEMACIMMRDGPENTTLVIDMRGFSFIHQDSQAMGFIIDTFQNRYPERMGRALIISAPWLFSGFWRILRPWLDPVVQSKVNFIESPDLPKFLSPKQMVKHLGGELRDFGYIEPTEDEAAALKARRADTAQRDKAWEDFAASLHSFIEQTLDWAATPTDPDAAGDARDALDRIDTAQGLRIKYDAVVAHVRSPTNYHRFGALDEPAFRGVVQIGVPPTTAE